MFVYEFSYNIKQDFVRSEKYEAWEDNGFIMIKWGCCGVIRVGKEDFEKVNITSDSAHMYSFDCNADKFMCMVKEQLMDEIMDIKDSIYELRLKENKSSEFLESVKKWLERS